MLRLWPETLYAGLFPGHSWLTGARMPAPVDGRPGADGAGLLAGLEAMLSQLPEGVGRRRGLHLVVSDSIAAMAALPWQEHLRHEDELDAYAQACFEDQGQVIDGAWVAQTAFRRHRGAGLAFALPRAWLLELLAICERFQVRLRTVLPVSAAAYHRIDARGGGQTVLLLAEESRITAMVYEAGRLVRIDVQPVINGASIAGERLLLRVAAGFNTIDRVCFWSAVHDDADLQTRFVGACLPAAQLSYLARDAWGR